MRFIVSKIVDADNAIEALKKAKRTPVTQVYIHDPTWEKENYGIKDPESKKIGFDNAKK